MYQREIAMHTQKIVERQHDHVFGQDQEKAGEKRTLLIVVVTARGTLMDSGPL